MLVCVCAAPHGANTRSVCAISFCTAALLLVLQPVCVVNAWSLCSAQRCVLVRLLLLLLPLDICVCVVLSLGMTRQRQVCINAWVWYVQPSNGSRASINDQGLQQGHSVGWSSLRSAVQQCCVNMADLRPDARGVCCILLLYYKVHAFHPFHLTLYFLASQLAVQVYLFCGLCGHSLCQGLTGRGKGGLPLCCAAVRRGMYHTRMWTACCLTLLRLLQVISLQL